MVICTGWTLVSETKWLLPLEQFETCVEIGQTWWVGGIVDCASRGTIHLQTGVRSLPRERGQFADGVDLVGAVVGVGRVQTSRVAGEFASGAGHGDA